MRRFDERAGRLEDADPAADAVDVGGLADLDEAGPEEADKATDGGTGAVDAPGLLNRLVLRKGAADDDEGGSSALVGD